MSITLGKAEGKSYAIPDQCVNESKILPKAIVPDHLSAGAVGTLPFLWNITQSDGIHTRDEVQTLTIDATGGTFTAAWDGGTASSPIAEDRTSATLQTALRALHSDLESVTVTGDGPHVITFAGAAVTGKPIGLTRLLFNGALLTGGAGASVAVTTAGSTGVTRLTALDGSPQVIPSGAIVTNCWLQGVKSFASSGSATVKVGLDADDDAFTPDTAYNNGEFTANAATIAGTTLPLVVTADGQVQITISTAALTAGELLVHVDFKRGL
jgi:hypothetical protein